MTGAKELLSMVDSLTKDCEVVVVAWPFLRRTEASKKLYEVRIVTVYGGKHLAWWIKELKGGIFLGLPWREKL